jgi:ATP/maltotriose-dependent transcriptional regulator MalT
METNVLTGSSSTVDTSTACRRLRNTLRTRGPPSELRVLRYLPSNLSRPQIATELSVSVNTIGTHIRSIYAKLGAEGRSAAVHRARELRLLSTVRT